MGIAFTAHPCDRQVAGQVGQAGDQSDAQAVGHQVRGDVPVQGVVDHARGEAGRAAGREHVGAARTVGDRRDPVLVRRVRQVGALASGQGVVRGDDQVERVVQQGLLVVADVTHGRVVRGRLHDRQVDLLE